MANECLAYKRKSGLNIVGHNATVIGWGAIDDDGKINNSYYLLSSDAFKLEFCEPSRAGRFPS